MIKTLFIGLVLAATSTAFAQVQTATEEIAQEIIVDNLKQKSSTPEIYFTGKWCPASNKEAIGTKAIESCGTELSEYFYMPNVNPGVYEVYVRWTLGKLPTTNVPVTVRSSEFFQDIDGNVSTVTNTQTVLLNQAQDAGTWVYLGPFTSVGGAGSLGVKISNQNGIANTDGIRLIKVGEYTSP